jgi:hypothetical protein
MVSRFISKIMIKKDQNKQKMVPPIRLSRTFYSLWQPSVSPRPAYAPRRPRCASSPAAPCPARPASAVLLSRSCLQIPSRLMRSVLLTRPVRPGLRLCLWLCAGCDFYLSSDVCTAVLFFCLISVLRAAAVAVLMYRFFFLLRSAWSLL